MASNCQTPIDITPVPAISAGETATATKPFPFFNLPGEMRNKVYSYVFHGRVFIHVYSGFTIDNDSSDYFKTITLLRACKQIYHEALPLFYRNIYFSAIDHDLLEFLDNIGPMVRANITRLFIHWHATVDMVQAFRSLSECTSLVTFELTIFDDGDLGVKAKNIAQHLRPTMHELSHLRGLKQVQIVSWVPDGGASDDGYWEWLMGEMTKPREEPSVTS